LRCITPAARARPTGNREARGTTHSGTESIAHPQGGTG